MEDWLEEEVVDLKGNVDESDMGVLLPVSVALYKCEGIG